MHTYIVEEYQRWAKRQYLNPLICKAHPSIDCLIYGTHEGIFVKCPMCLYKRNIGADEYREIEAAVNLAKTLFREQ